MLMSTNFMEFLKGKYTERRYSTDQVINKAEQAISGIPFVNKIEFSGRKDAAEIARVLHSELGEFVAGVILKEAPKKASIISALEESAWHVWIKAKQEKLMDPKVISHLRIFSSLGSFQKSEATHGPGTYKFADDLLQNYFLACYIARKGLVALKSLLGKTPLPINTINFLVATVDLTLADLEILAQNAQRIRKQADRRCAYLLLFCSPLTLESGGVIDTLAKDASPIVRELLVFAGAEVPNALLTQALQKMFRNDSTVTIRQKALENLLLTIKDDAVLRELVEEGLRSPYIEIRDIAEKFAKDFDLKIPTNTISAGDQLIDPTTLLKKISRGRVADRRAAIEQLSRHRDPQVLSGVLALVEDGSYSDEASLYDLLNLIDQYYTEPAVRFQTQLITRERYPEERFDFHQFRKYFANLPEDQVPTVLNVLRENLARNFSPENIKYISHVASEFFKCIYSGKVSAVEITKIFEELIRAGKSTDIQRIIKYLFKVHKFYARIFDEEVFQEQIQVLQAFQIEDVDPYKRYSHTNGEISEIEFTLGYVIPFIISQKQTNLIPLLTEKFYGISPYPALKLILDALVTLQAPEDVIRKLLTNAFSFARHDYDLGLHDPRQISAVMEIAPLCLRFKAPEEGEVRAWILTILERTYLYEFDEVKYLFNAFQQVFPPPYFDLYASFFNLYFYKFMALQGRDSRGDRSDEEMKTHEHLKAGVETLRSLWEKIESDPANIGMFILKLARRGPEFCFDSTKQELKLQSEWCMKILRRFHTQGKIQTKDLESIRTALEGLLTGNFGLFKESVLTLLPGQKAIHQYIFAEKVTVLGVMNEEKSKQLKYLPYETVDMKIALIELLTEFDSNIPQNVLHSLLNHADKHVQEYGKILAKKTGVSAKLENVTIDITTMIDKIRLNSSKLPERAKAVKAAVNSVKTTSFDLTPSLNASNEEDLVILLDIVAAGKFKKYRKAVKQIFSTGSKDIGPRALATLLALDNDPEKIIALLDAPSIPEQARRDSLLSIFESSPANGEKVAVAWYLHAKAMHHPLNDACEVISTIFSDPKSKNSLPLDVITDFYPLKSPQSQQDTWFLIRQVIKLKPRDLVTPEAQKVYGQIIRYIGKTLWASAQTLQVLPDLLESLIDTQMLTPYFDGFDELLQPLEKELKEGQLLIDWERQILQLGIKRYPSEMMMALSEKMRSRGECTLFLDTLEFFAKKRDLDLTLSIIERFAPRYLIWLPLKGSWSGFFRRVEKTEKVHPLLIRVLPFIEEYYSRHEVIIERYVTSRTRKDFSNVVGHVDDLISCALCIENPPDEFKHRIFTKILLPAGFFKREYFNNRQLFTLVEWGYAKAVQPIALNLLKKQWATFVKDPSWFSGPDELNLAGKIAALLPKDNAELIEEIVQFATKARKQYRSVAQEVLITLGFYSNTSK